MLSKEELENLLPKLEQDRIEKTISVNDTNKFGEAQSSSFLVKIYKRK